MTASRDERLATLFARTHAGIKPGLELMEELLEALGNPQKKFLSIHVAGTNGKGSTCALLESAVRQLGLRSGLFTSPHLVKVNERIRVNGEEVSDEIFYGLLDQVQAVEGSLSRLPTFFETLTAMGFLAFAQQRVQVAVLETGMGGRLDCTNVVEPLCSVITRVDFDHMAYLGNTLPRIAFEKAGIIKPGRPVVIGAQQKEAQAVLTSRAVETGSPCRLSVDSVRLNRLKQSLKGQTVEISGSAADYGRVLFPLPGAFQLENLCTAVCVMEWIPELLGLDPDPEWVGSAVEKVCWRGRGQVLSEDPPLLLDVAHNPGGAKALAGLLTELFGRKAKGVLFWGGLADKDSAGFIRTLQPRISGCVCLDLQSERARPSRELKKIAEDAGIPAQISTVSGAKGRVREWIGDADFGIVAGSVYLGGEWLGGMEPDSGERLSGSSQD